MNKRIFDWTRYWYQRKRNGKEPYIQDGLLIGINKYGDDFADDWLFELTSILDSPCLILLGEPGMGKSYALESVAKILEQTESEDRFCFIDLADYATASELIQEIFDNNPDFPLWQSANFNLHIFLDGLDEAQIQAKSILNRLRRALNQRDIDTNRFFLRIVCRSSDWKNEFEDLLNDVWEEDEVRVFILAPLQKTDVLEAAEFCDINAQDFWQEVTHKNAQPFAERPITLNFLLEEYRTTGQLPRQRSEVYRRGLLSLCRELKTTHQERDQLEPEQRLNIGARIAACMIFTGKTIVGTSSRQTDGSIELTIEDCAGGKEIVGEVEADAWESSIRETLDTALFQGSEHRKWAHHTYAEFLAAYYVINKLSIPQIKALLIHPDGHLVPQLQETAAWIASQNEEILRAVLSSDPAVLLRGDVVGFDNELKQDLTVALLERAKFDTRIGIRSKLLAPLEHPDLAKTLKPSIESSEVSLGARILAVGIATECGIIDLQTALLNLVLDPNEHHHLRVAAAWGINAIGDEETKCLLKPLALLAPNNSSNRQLKLYGIRATWPCCLSAEEFFETLHSSVDDDVIDSYTSNSWESLILPLLSAEDLPFALRWIQKQKALHELPFNFLNLLDGILRQSWDSLEVVGVAEPLAATIVALWSRYDRVLDRPNRGSIIGRYLEPLSHEEVLGDVEKRKLLFEHLLPIASRLENAAYQFVYDMPLIHFEDATWLIDKFNNIETPSEQELIAELIRRIVKLMDPDHFDFIYGVGEQNPSLWEKLNYQLSVELGSEEAKAAKDRYMQVQERELHRQKLKEERSLPLLSPPPLERAISCLEAFADGDLDAWWKMSRWMNFDATGHSDHFTIATGDFTELPLWDELDVENQNKIIELAPKYLKEYEVESNPWREKPSSIYHPIVAGIRAFAIILARQVSSLPSLQQSVWDKWAQSMVYHSYQTSTIPESDDSKSYKVIWNTVSSKSRSEFIDSILWIIDLENSNGEIYVVDYLDEFIDDEMAALLLEKVEGKSLQVENAKKVLRLARSYQHSLVHEILTNWLLQTTEDLSEDNKWAIAAAQLILEKEPDFAWDTIWKKMQESQEYGKAVIEGIARFDRRKANLIGNLSDHQIAQLYLWPFSVYPPEKDPKREGSYRVTMEHEVAYLRDALLSQLTQRGTSEALEELIQIQEKLELDLKSNIEQAKSLLRQNTWIPLEPQQLLALSRDQNTRWIQSGEQLLDVVIEILQELNDELQGKSGSTPSAIDLWNEYSIKKEDKKRQLRHTPKDENRLSDYVERYLKQELVERNVFISRETQIRRGSFTDIYIESRSIDSTGELGEPISVVIEVKGCWHDDLKTAMKDQLRNRYMVENGIKFGIYLVGQFMCSAWSTQDDQSRHDKCRRVSDEKMASDLEAQAAELSDGFDIRSFVLDVSI